MTITQKLTQAIKNLAPTAEWVLRGENYSDIEWYSDEIDMPTEYEITREINKIEQEFINTEYQRLRVKEYPPIVDYLDGIVKGDQSQIDEYIAKCLAVKAKYPKS